MSSLGGTVPPSIPECRVRLLERIADLWQGDWTGDTFDGRDGARWIRTAIEADEAELAKLAEELTEVERTYE